MKKKQPHIVFDLDDTLYFEVEYVKSCFQFISILLSSVYGIPETLTMLLELRSQGERDPVAAVFAHFALPLSAKSDVISAMRTHKPQIFLPNEAKTVLDDLLESRRSVSIVTDGRSITQRRKLEALELLGRVIPYISEETGHPKPSEKPFLLVQKDQPEAKSFWYVADNPAKDFFAPNRLGWVTVMLRAAQYNIHEQSITDEAFAPQHEVDSLTDICQLPGYTT